MTVGAQIAEVLQRHTSMDKLAMQSRMIELLQSVGIPDPTQRLTEYPFQFSGGMKQRVMIAMALAAKPELLIADEPTTALDVTIQAQVLDLMRDLQQQAGMAILLITHDLGVVAEMAHQIGVMYAGEMVECTSREKFSSNPLTPIHKNYLQHCLPDRNVTTRWLSSVEKSPHCQNHLPAAVSLIAANKHGQCVMPPFHHGCPLHLGTRFAVTSIPPKTLHIPTLRYRLRKKSTSTPHMTGRTTRMMHYWKFVI